MRGGTSNQLRTGALDHDYEGGGVDPFLRRSSINSDVARSYVLPLFKSRFVFAFFLYLFFTLFSNSRCPGAFFQERSAGVKKRY
jgi:hypothetical protein